MRKSLLPLLSLALLLIFSPGTIAQQEIRDPYSAGVSAYNSGQLQAAEEQLDLAIEESPLDPMGYYFRGLTKLAQGDRLEGIEDIRQGATLELAGGYSYATIQRGIATVQGPARTTLEQVRREVRLAAERVARTEPARARRAAWEEQEKKVLRTRTELPIEALVNQLTPDQALAAANKSRGEVEEHVVVDEPADEGLAQNEPSEGAEVNPFADEPNPFADEPAEAPAADMGPVVTNQPADSPFTGDPFLESVPQQQPPRAAPGGAAPGGAALGGGPSGPEMAAGAFRVIGKILGDLGRVQVPDLPGGGDAGFGPPGADFGRGGGGFQGPGDGFGEPDDDFGPGEEMAPEEDDQFGPPDDDLFASPDETEPETIEGPEEFGGPEMNENPATTSPFNFEVE